jgi:hypothetical protein
VKAAMAATTAIPRAAVVQRMRPTEVAPDVFAMDEWSEHKHPRDQGGKFSSGGGGGAAAAPAGSAGKQTFKTKKEHIAHLLTNGITPKELMSTMGWPSVSMPAQAKSLGMKLEKKDGKYYGTPMTDAEKAAAKAEEKGKKTDAQAQQILKNAGIAAEPKPAPAKPAEPPKPAPAPAPEPAKPKLPTPTPEEAKKAVKSAKLQLAYVPGEKPQAGGFATSAQSMVELFNTKWEGKDNLAPIQIAEKVADFKALQAGVNELATVEKKATQEQAEAAAKAAKEATEKAAKAKAEAEAKKKADEQKRLDEKFAKDPELKQHYEAMQAVLGGHKAVEQYTKMAEEKIKAAGLSDKIRGPEAVAIVAYSGSHYAQLNAQIRSGTMSVDQYKFMKSLNAALDKLPAHTKTTFRKASLSPEQFAAYKPGMITEERAFMSTSKKQATWSGNHTFEVNGKSGRDISKLSSHPGEAEVLFKSGSRFLVKEVKGTHIVLEEV